MVEKKIEAKQRIMWGRLKGEVTSSLVYKINSRGYAKQSDDANYMLETMANTI